MTNGKEKEMVVAPAVIEFWERYVSYLEKGDVEGARASLKNISDNIIQTSRYQETDKVSGLLNDYISDLLYYLQTRVDEK